jgi:hypothetical protein
MFDYWRVSMMRFGIEIARQWIDMFPLREVCATSTSGKRDQTWLVLTSKNKK